MKDAPWQPGQPLPELLPIRPFPRYGRKGKARRVRIPGSKSITNRALILAALNKGSVTLRGALFSRDTRIMAACLRELGFAVQEDEATKSIAVDGLGGAIPRTEARLHVGNAGTAARFLTAFLTLQKGGTYHLDGDEAMRRRPMSGLLDTLRELGAEVDFQGEPGHFPFTLRTNGLLGGEWLVDASASSQILSALMLVAPCAEAPVALRLAGATVSLPFVSMTAEMMRIWGAHITGYSSPFTIEDTGYAYSESEYTVEPDVTAASYFGVLPLATRQPVELLDLANTIAWREGEAKVELQGDSEFFDTLTDSEWVSIEITDSAAFLVRKPDFSPIDFHEPIDFNAFSDTFLTLAAVAPLLPESVEITGIRHTRFQECDRVLAMATELERLGQQVGPSASELAQDTEKTLGSLTIHGNRAILKETVEQKGIRLEGLTHPVIPIETYEDHRVAMSFAILGSHDLFGDGRPWLAIKDPVCCGKTFPDFFDKLETLRQGNDAD